MPLKLMTLDQLRELSREAKMLATDTQNLAEDIFNGDYDDRAFNAELREAKSQRQYAAKVDREIQRRLERAKRNVAKELKPRAGAFTQPAPRARRGIGSY